MTDLICSLEDCAGRHYARAMCRKHYDRLKRAEWREAPARLCETDGCGAAHNARGMCIKHYKKWQAENRPCEIESCARKSARQGFCRGHWDRWKKYGDPLSGPPIKERAPNGSPRPIFSSGGYVLTWSPAHPNAQANGYVLEHVAVMAADMGRPLAPGENVHHINGDKADNRRANLELWVTMQPSGQRPSDLVRYALEILERYGADPDDSRHMGGPI